MIQGSNFAECHPVGFRWVMEAKRRGATVIHVDPRFTRTSAMADLHVPIRAGTDIAFLGGLIRFVIEEGRWFREYVTHYTNAGALLREDLRDPEDLDGLFSGWDPQQGRYELETWQYQGVDEVVPAAGHKELFASGGAGHQDRARGRTISFEHQDPTLQHPRCVFQVLRRHFQRYTPEMVEATCGVPRATFLRVAEAITRNSGRERTTAFAYSVGWTQHSVGVQYIRTAAILQLLLGNIGRPGGGILALRGHASIQGSTDIPTLYNLLPGYIPMPHDQNAASLDDYLHSNEAATAWWSELPKYVVSLLTAWFGPQARREAEFGFGLLPRLTGNHSHLVTVADMADGKLEGYFVMGENPAVGSANAGLQRRALGRLRWLVVRDLVLTETAEFWRQGPEHERGETSPESIDTEVFFFPAAAHTEKDGSFTNTQRLLQWHHKAVEPPGAARSELHFMFHLGRRLKQRYAGSSAARDRAIQALTWDYPTQGPHQDPDAEAVLAEINGYRVADGSPVSGFTELAADGSTACGCWIYAGCRAEGKNQTARRRPAAEQRWVAPEWGWAWPANRRILYNRASADPQGRPWSERKRLVWWDSEQGRWVGHDVPDFLADRAPDYEPPEGAEGLAAISGRAPFIMQADGKGWLYAPSGLLDGPLPTHYEPQESIVPNPLYAQQCNPVRLEWRRPDNPYARACADPRFPLVATTFRLTEHHTAGGMSRWLPWLTELQPAAFCEVSPELAAERGLSHGGWATVSSARGAIELRVLVTRRLRPLSLAGRRVHQIALPWHWGTAGLTRGGSVNDLLPFVADPNVNIPESKLFAAEIQPGRRGTRGPVPDGTGHMDGQGRDLPGAGPPLAQPDQRTSKT